MEEFIRYLRTNHGITADMLIESNTVCYFDEILCRTYSVKNSQNNRWHCYSIYSGLVQVLSHNTELSKVFERRKHTRFFTADSFAYFDYKHNNVYLCVKAGYNPIIKLELELLRLYRLQLTILKLMELGCSSVPFDKFVLQVFSGSTSITSLHINDISYDSVLHYIIEDQFKNNVFEVYRNKYYGVSNLDNREVLSEKLMLIVDTDEKENNCKVVTMEACNGAGIEALVSLQEEVTQKGCTPNVQWADFGDMLNIANILK